MIAVAVLCYVVGVAVIVTTVLSAVRTVVLPRGVPVKLSRAVFLFVRFCFDLWGRRAKTYEDRDRAMALYAPLALLSLPLVWLSLTLGGYTLLFWAIGERPWSLAFTTSGSSLFTLGFVRPEGWGPIILSFTEAFLGIAVLTLLLVTYLPSMYAAFSRREQSVALLEVRAGSPPSGVELLSRMARIDGLHRLTPMFVAWETWFVDLEESHTSLPALSFFRSPQPEHSWVTAAGAVLDAAALYVSTVELDRLVPHHEEEIRVPEAETCIRAGYLTLRRLATFFQLPVDQDPRPDDPIAVSREEYDEACATLAEAGVPLLRDRDQSWRDFAGWRVNYDGALLALASLTMAPYAPWSSDRSVIRRGVGRRRRPQAAAR